MAHHFARIAADGSLMLPEELREEAGLLPGMAVSIDVHDGALTLRSFDDALAWAQDLVAQYVPAGVSLADELIRERREAAERE